MELNVSHLLCLLAIASILELGAEAGVIKDLFQKITHSNNKTEDVVKQSAPICGSGVFSTPDERSLSPEIIFISNRPSRSKLVAGNGQARDEFSRNKRANGNTRTRDGVNEVANEFRFHEENVTLRELESYGFNPNAPVTFLMHGFTSGYPLQAWISAIVEAYTIDRHGSSSQGGGHHAGRGQHSPVEHNLFIINWNYAARGILYPRAVANIPIVAGYVTRFINAKLLDEARVEPRRIQLIGHSLGAHLAGFIGKNSQEKLGRIYGLDPAGPCFGAISGPLYPSSKRLASNDANEVITIHTNTVLLGIDKPLGKYSVFVEGGKVQPGCKGGGVLKSIGTLTWDGGDFDTVACSHSRAPNLLTYRHDQSDSRDDCQLVAYECRDWEAFASGQCGICESSGSSSERRSRGGSDPLQAVDCIRLGLDWQYSEGSHGSNSGSSSHEHQPNGYRNTTSGHDSYNYGSPNGRSTTRRPSSYDQDEYSSSSSGGYNNNSNDYHIDRVTSSRRPASYDQGDHGSSSNGNHNNENGGWRLFTRRPPNQDSYGSGTGQYDRNSETSYSNGRQSTRRPYSSSSHQRDRRDAGNSPSGQETERRRESEEPVKSMFIRTGDTQPYCAYHYQVVLELNEPFPGKKPPMSILLQDADQERGQSTGSGRGQQQQNSLSNDEFGNKFNDRVYTHLLTSGKKLKRVDHATLLFRDGLPDGFRILKTIHINYMSHIEPRVRQSLSTRLCLARNENDRNGDGRNHNQSSGNNRFYFEPCSSHSNGPDSSSQSSQSSSSYYKRKSNQGYRNSTSY